MQILGTSIGWADLALMLVVTAQSAGFAYLHSPRAKALLYAMPLPFSTGMIASGRSVDATHVSGMFVVWAMLWLAWWLHARRGVRILPTIGLCVAFQAVLAALLLAVIPDAPRPWLFFGLAMALVAANLVALAIPPGREAGHRSSLPFYVKIPAVFLLVAALVILKDRMRGFMPTFPFASIFAIYEARHSLHGLARRSPILSAGLMAVCMSFYVFLPSATGNPAASYLLPLVIGWSLHLPIWWLCDRLLCRWDARRSSLC